MPAAVAAALAALEVEPFGEDAVAGRIDVVVEMPDEDAGLVEPGGVAVRAPAGGGGGDVAFDVRFEREREAFRTKAFGLFFRRENRRVAVAPAPPGGVRTASEIRAAARAGFGDGAHRASERRCCRKVMTWFCGRISGR